MQDSHVVIRQLVKAALDEDIGPGDLTSRACLEPDPLRAEIVAKCDGVLSGLEPALLVFDIVDSANVVTPCLQNGDRFNTGDRILTIEGFNQTVMTSERTALNFLAHLSGVATLTRQFVDLVSHTECKILDTRKTTPGWRLLEKMAVVHGGGQNHRMGLYDMILVKDNHIASAGSIEAAVGLAREFLHSGDYILQFETPAEDMKIEVEVTTSEQVLEALNANADILLLDNQGTDSLKELVALARRINPLVKLEASGNVSLTTVKAIAETGVDYISVGALTHSAPAADFSLRVVE
jgi:nicotinate-nucleotide pyrophosphorylase (carboxylating)